MIRVIKLGGRVQSDPELAVAIASLWNSSPGGLCIVHGGGDEISGLQRALGREPVFINGRRVTTPADMELVRMVLSGSTNKRLIATLRREGLPAVGISGEDAGLLSAEPIDPEVFGRSGRPVAADTAIINTLLVGGYLPVISPVGVDFTSSTNEPLNVNGDDASALIAAALAAELWLVADVEGVLDADQQLIDHLDEAQVEELVAAGTVNSGMQAKLEAGFEALARGASVVRIVGLAALASNGEGTSLSLTKSMQ
ncbi:MAG: acetylglutamate kinase [Gemmatimonadaceae bacterium]